MDKQYILWRRCKLSDKTRSMFQGTLEECKMFQYELVNSILIETLKENPTLDEDTIVAVEDAYFVIKEAN